MPAVEPTFENLHTPTVADVLDTMGIWGVIDPAVRLVNRTSRPFWGRAHTVRWCAVRKPSSIVAPQPSTWENVKNFLVPEIVDAAELVYVAGVDGGLLTSLALAGGFSSGHIERLGFRGMVLGGAIRDAHVVQTLDIPIYATNFTPADTQGNYRVSEVGTSCAIGHVTVTTGDYIFGDESGCVVVPAHCVSQVIAAANEIERREAEIKSRVASGESLYDIVARLGRL